MTKTQTLYGDYVDNIVIETQKSVARAKISATKKLLQDLVKVPMKDRDQNRIEKVIKAQKFNEKLLYEVDDEK